MTKSAADNGKTFFAGLGTSRVTVAASLEIPSTRRNTLGATFDISGWRGVLTFIRGRSLLAQTFPMMHLVFQA